MDTKNVIETLRLEPHVEGGHFRRTYASVHDVDINGHKRKLASSIYYLLTAEQPIGHLHRNRSDILHFYQLGSPLRYWVLEPDGKLQQTILGPDLYAGQQLQLLVPGGCWKASELVDGAYGLVSEVVLPGFDFSDMQLANKSQINELSPHHFQELLPFIKD